MDPADDEGNGGAPGREGLEEDAQEEEAREVRAPPIPITPSQQEVERHRLTHRPYRAWCPHCVRGKGRADQHRRSSQKEEWQGVPKLASDYFYIGQRRPTNRAERDREEG